MNFPNNFHFAQCIGKHTLLHGETNTGKTFYTAKFVQYLLEEKAMEPKLISILDFAPKLQKINDLKIGGRIEDYYGKSMETTYYPLENEIIPPRLNAKNKTQLFEYAYQNYVSTSKALNQYQTAPTPILIINDLSIYLHLGNKFFLLKVINGVETFFGNSYFGNSISKSFSKLFSLKEKRRITYIIKRIDKSFQTNQNSLI